MGVFKNAKRCSEHVIVKIVPQGSCIVVGGERAKKGRTSANNMNAATSDT